MLHTPPGSPLLFSTPSSVSVARLALVCPPPVGAESLRSYIQFTPRLLSRQFFPTSLRLLAISSSSSDSISRRSSSGTSVVRVASACSATVVFVHRDTQLVVASVRDRLSGPCQLCIESRHWFDRPSPLSQLIGLVWPYLIHLPHPRKEKNTDLGRHVLFEPPQKDTGDSSRNRLRTWPVS